MLITTLRTIYIFYGFRIVLVLVLIPAAHTVAKIAYFLIPAVKVDQGFNAFRIHPDLLRFDNVPGLRLPVGRGILVMQIFSNYQISSSVYVRRSFCCAEASNSLRIRSIQLNRNHSPGLILILVSPFQLIDFCEEV